MGNFSRSTFNVNKRYVGVRLQQGVPLVDADWNELNDVIRHEAYAIGQALSDGVEPGSDQLKISAMNDGGNSDNFGLTLLGLINPSPLDARIVIVSGRPLSFISIGGIAWRQYNKQVWYNDPDRAAQDQIDVILPLNTPKDKDRTDIVYLDVWEREVNSKEDINLINPAIGIETSTRLKREYAVRVAEGTTDLPKVPAGHSFLPLALLQRLRNQEKITADQIIDIRPHISIKGAYKLAFSPIFSPIFLEGPITAWQYNIMSISSDRSMFGFSTKPADESVAGILPLSLPDRAKIVAISFNGSTKIEDIQQGERPKPIRIGEDIQQGERPKPIRIGEDIQQGERPKPIRIGEDIQQGERPKPIRIGEIFNLEFALCRVNYLNGALEKLESHIISHPITSKELREFNPRISIRNDDQKCIVNNSTYYYVITAICSAKDFTANIRGITVDYVI